MKKLLSAIAISFVLSGCMNNVSLPNTNMQGAQSNSSELDFLGVHLSAAEICKHVNPKMEKRWTKHQENLSKIAKSYNQQDRERMVWASIKTLAGAYAIKNNIPMTGENLYKIANDKSLEKAMIKEAIITLKGTNNFCNLNYAEKLLRNFATKFGKENLL